MLVGGRAVVMPERAAVARDDLAIHKFMCPAGALSDCSLAVAVGTCQLQCREWTATDAILYRPHSCKVPCEIELKEDRDAPNANCVLCEKALDERDIHAQQLLSFGAIIFHACPEREQTQGKAGLGMQLWIFHYTRNKLPRTPTSSIELHAQAHGSCGCGKS
eukprot:4462986-Pleurochrysis_carterae.AAC.4